MAEEWRWLGEGLAIENESLEDVPLLMGIISELGISPLIDRYVKVHGNWQGVSVGTVVSLWLCYMLSTQDHRLVMVRDWVQAHRYQLSSLLGLDLRETDCSDDRLAIVLNLLGDERLQRELDEALLGEWWQIYPLPREIIRLDSSGVRVHHHREEGSESLFQFGFSHSPPADMRQFKVMMATLDPLGLPLTASVVSGERSDHLLYVPSYEAAVSVLGSRDVLVVGDSKMSPLGIRGYLVQQGSCYLCPLSDNFLPGETRFAWINEAVQNPENWIKVYSRHDQDQSDDPIAVVVERQQLLSWTPTTGDPVGWSERVLLVRSAQLRQHQLEGLTYKLKRTCEQLEKWQQPAGRGRKRYHSYEALWKDVQQLLNEAGLFELIKVELGQQPLPKGESRWVVESYRLDLAVWETLCARLGWRVYATNAPAERFSAATLVDIYRHQMLHERVFARLKTQRLNIRPIYLRNEHRLLSLVWLLELALRVLILTEFRIRHALSTAAEGLVGLNPAVPSEVAYCPTADRVLATFSQITLTLIHQAEQTFCHITPLTDTQRRILALLGLPETLYTSLTLQPP